MNTSEYLWRGSIEHDTPLYIFNKESFYNIQQSVLNTTRPLVLYRPEWLMMTETKKENCNVWVFMSGVFFHFSVNLPCFHFLVVLLFFWIIWKIVGWNLGGCKMPWTIKQLIYVTCQPKEHFQRETDHR